MRTNYRNEKPSRNPKQSKPFSKGRTKDNFRKKDDDFNDSGKKSFEKRPFEKKPFERKSFDKKPFKERSENYNPHAKYGKKDDNFNEFERKPFEKKPFERKSFDKKPFRERSENYNPHAKYGKKDDNFNEFERKPFERKPFDKKPFRERSEDYNPHAKYSLKKQIEYKKRTLHESSEIRLNRFLANAGLCSRREADEYIKAGVVSVNGQIVTEMGTKVTFKDKVLFHDQLIKSEKKVYILLNKPKDCVTTSDDPQERLTVMDLIKDACTERVYPVGRLDRNTTGVLLLTNDGDIAARLTHPKYNKKKIYHVFLDKALTKADMETVAKGISLDDGEIRADNINYADETDKKQVGVEIHSGRNRIVRRIFEHLGYRVEKLDRVYFAGLTKKNLPRGKYRFLSEKEVSMLSMGAYN